MSRSRSGHEAFLQPRRYRGAGRWVIAPILAAMVVATLAFHAGAGPVQQAGDPGQAVAGERPETVASPTPARGPRKHPLSDFFLDSATVESATIESATTESARVEDGSARGRDDSLRSAVVASTDSVASRAEAERAALSGTGFQPATHGQDAHATTASSATGFQPVTHGQPTPAGRDAHAATPVAIRPLDASPTPPLYIVPPPEDDKTGAVPAATPKTSPTDTPKTSATPTPKGGSFSTRNARKAKATPTPSPLDLNSATVDQLAALPGLDPERARLIVAHRTTISGFRSKMQLRDVFGITDAVYERIAPLVAVNAPSVSQDQRKWAFPSGSPALNPNPATPDSTPSPRTSDSILTLPTLPNAAETPISPDAPSSPAAAASPKPAALPAAQSTSAPTPARPVP